MRVLRFAALAAIGLAGCVVASPEEGNPAIGETDDPLYGKLSDEASWWNSAPGQPASIEVCWTPLAMAGKRADGSSIPTTPGVAKIRAWVREAVENSWGRVANISIRGWDSTCASDARTSSPGMIMFMFDDSKDASGTRIDKDSCDFLGKMATDGTMIRINGTKTTRQGYNTYAVHEFGHALGFAHEMVRPDNWQNGVPTVCTSLAGGENEPQAGGELLTPDVDGKSIMCYGGDPYPLSPGDVRGAQKRYGRKPSGSIVGLGGRCVNISYGNSVMANQCDGPSTWFYKLLSGTKLEGLASDNAIGSCLDVMGRAVSSTSQTRLNAQTCGNYSSQKFPATGMRWHALGNMCVVVDSTVSGSKLKIAKCGGTAKQKWDFFAPNSSQIRLNGTNQCVTIPSAGAATMGAVPELASCSSTNNAQKFVIDNNLIRYSNLCFNVLGGLPTENASIGLWNGCDSSPQEQNEQFHMSGYLKTLSQCAAFENDVSADYQSAVVRTCKSAPAKETLDPNLPAFYPPDPQTFDLYW